MCSKLKCCEILGEIEWYPHRSLEYCRTHLALKWAWGDIVADNNNFNPPYSSVKGRAWVIASEEKPIDIKYSPRYCTLDITTRVELRRRTFEGQSLETVYHC
jgi:hypothetical protein